MIFRTSHQNIGRIGTLEPNGTGVDRTHVKFLKLDCIIFQNDAALNFGMARRHLGAGFGFAERRTGVPVPAGIPE